MRLVARNGRLSLDESDPSLRLTDEQQAAVRPGHEVVLEAGAGAGKTHTLALRYVALLVDIAWTEAAVERVLVLTFTEKAADEMADRCRRRLTEAARAARQPLDGITDADRRRVTAHLDRMVERFERARISTFHGFCARLLQEFPRACRTPAGVSVLEPTEERRWRDEALEEALDALVAARPEDLPPLLDALGSRGQLLTAGRQALGARAVLEPTLRDHASGRDRLAERVARATLDPSDARAFLEKTAIPALGLLLRVVAPSGGGAFAERVRELLPELKPDADTLRTWSRYREALELPLTARGTLRSLDHPTVLGPKSAWPDERRYAQARDAAKVLQGRLADWPARARLARTLPTPADRTLLEALVPFSRWVLEALGRLDRRLDDERRVTFDLMQQRAVEGVLRDPAMRAELRRRHRHLVVDEFQDTDERQWSLVRALARERPGVPEDRVFVVGDPKQAIYGFRGGDVTVFRRAIDELGVRPDRLSRNFRSGSTLVGWFNEAFPGILAGGERWEARYEPVEAAAGEGGEVELWHVPEDQDPAAVVASRLVELLAPGSALLDRTAHPAPPIAVLLRTRTRQHRLEAELRRRRVPYVVAQGVGFWSRPEVVDLANVLAAAATDDPVAVVAWLRSPLGGADDDEVGALGSEGLRALARGTASGPWAARLAELRAELGAHPASVWLARRAREALPVFTLAEPDGRAEANADRLVTLARRWDARGAEAAAGWMLGEIRAEEREGEVLATPSAARVVISTVHAAKGLEFPVVVVPELDARPRGTTGPLLVGREERWELAFRVEDEGARVQTRVKPGAYQALHALLRAQQDAEERRLLYVACTRARERLILVGRPQGEADAAAFPTWMQHVARVLPRSTRIGLGRATDVRLALAVADAPPPRSIPAAPRVPVLELDASALDRFAACPARFWLLDLEGRPEPLPVARDRATRLAALRGRVLHELLEDGVSDPTVAERRFRSAAAEEAADPTEVEAGSRGLLTQLERTLALPEVRRALSAPGAAEVPFRVVREGVALRGRLDRLWRDGDTHVVLDWKTEARPRDDHGRQLLAYAWAATELGAEVTRGQVVFTALGRVEELGPWGPAERAAIPSLVDEVRRAASEPFARIRDEAITSARPCDRCGFLRRACPGSRVRSGTTSPTAS